MKGGCRDCIGGRRNREFLPAKNHSHDLRGGEPHVVIRFTPWYFLSGLISRPDVFVTVTDVIKVVIIDGFV